MSTSSPTAARRRPGARALAVVLALAMAVLGVCSFIASSAHAAGEYTATTTSYTVGTASWALDVTHIGLTEANGNPVVAYGFNYNADLPGNRENGDVPTAYDRTSEVDFSDLTVT